MSVVEILINIFAISNQKRYCISSFRMIKINIILLNTKKIKK